VTVNFVDKDGSVRASNLDELTEMGFVSPKNG